MSSARRSVQNRKNMRRQKRPPLLRPMDIAWQAYQAGAALYEELVELRFGYDIKQLNAQFKAWWARHPRTNKDGGLK